MFARGVILISFHLLFLQTAFAQDDHKSERWYGNYKGYGLGIAYPFYTIKPSYYEWDTENLNSGFEIKGEIGKAFNSGFSLSLAPSILYSSFGKRNYRYEINDPAYQLLISYREGYRKYYHISITLPLVLEYQISKAFNFGLGGYIMKPIIGSGRDVSSGYKYFEYYPEFGFYYEYPEPLRTGSNSFFKGLAREEYAGLIGELSIPVSSGNRNRKLLMLTYMHSLTSDYETGYYEKWIILSLINRTINAFNQKEKRKSWDRY